MNYENLKKTWHEEEKKAFSGWDFSHLQSRWHHQTEGWSYKAIVREYLQPTDRLLDMDTGGGEFLLSLGHPYDRTSVTEAWEPNIQLCMEKLAPLGIQVYPVRNHLQLSIPDNQFDMVINRHGTYDLGEVSRILKPGGMFITQQVGGENCIAFARRINPDYEPMYEEFSLATELPKFQENGFSVKYSDESHPELQFFDVGAVVFWAKIIEWTFPNFSVDNNFSQLCSLQDEIVQKGLVSALQHRLIIAAQNQK